MRLNESTAVSTAKVLLVPYDRRHVPTYHAWMEDPAIQEATASERLTLDEEFENQASWRASHDKLTFIVCRPLEPGELEPEEPGDASAAAGRRCSVEAGGPDAPERMVGDVNLFLYPDEEEDDEDDEDDEEGEGADSADHPRPFRVAGEVDIMIADRRHRGMGLGRAAVRAFLQYVARHQDGILCEYARDKDLPGPGPGPGPRLGLLMAKINKGNARSIALFRSLGFAQEGEVNYFGEVRLVLRDLGALAADVPEGYAELVYSRSDSSLSQDGEQ